MAEIEQIQRDIMDVAICIVGCAIYEVAKEVEEEEERARLKRRRQRRRWWTRKWILRRQQLGAYDQLMRELQLEDEASFTNFLRLTPDTFQEVLAKVGPHIQKQHTKFREPLPAGVKLAITLRYLATGDSYQDLGFQFRVPRNSISLFLPEVCQAILDEYAAEHLSCPTTPERWKEVADQFETRWNFPHCCGALDGKHVRVKCPPRSGSQFFNYKGFFSVVLMALVDANYKFLYVECGFSGSASDGGIFSSTELFQHLDDDIIGLPPAEPLAGADEAVNYFIVGDEAFPLKTWLMKPLPQRNMTDQQRIFNYRLSRARRVVENAFGILSARFRCFHSLMQQFPERVTTIVLTACCLHNMLMDKKLPGDRMLVDREDPDTHDIIPGTWRQEPSLDALAEGMRNFSYGTREARAQREYLVEYVNSEVGSVPWQQDMI